jgi:hypothetical protein
LTADVFHGALDGRFAIRVIHGPNTSSGSIPNTSQASGADFIALIALLV